MFRQHHCLSGHEFQQILEDSGGQKSLSGYHPYMHAKLHQSYPTLCDPMDCSPQAPLSWDSPGKNTGVGYYALLQGIFPTQGLNPGLPHCRQILYQLSHKGNPRILEWVAYTFAVDLPNPGIELGSSALQADSLPTELSGQPFNHLPSVIKKKKQQTSRIEFP